MSNIGRISLVVPSNLDVKVIGWKLFIKGPFNEKTLSLPLYTKVVKTESLLYLKPHQIKAKDYGTMQKKLKAFLHGISYVFIKRLLFVGVGYRARQEKDNIIIRLGFSHEICLKIPDNIDLKIVKRNNVILKGSSYEQLSQFAYKLRSYRQPEPFKGKGIVCLGEKVRRKEGKKKKV